MQNSSGNPLQKHFRQPQIFLKLPSEGRWWGKDNLDLPPTGEIPIYAMTAKDELLLKTPDALLNGQSTVDVIQSCCPNIKNAWMMPLIDLDSVLIGIRQATYGNEMEITSVCTHCGSQNEIALDLSVYNGTITCPDYSRSLIIDNLEFYFKPITYKIYNDNSVRNFEEQRLLQSIENSGNLSDNEKAEKFSEMFRNILDMTINQMVDNIAAIKTGDGDTVTDRTFINEFFQNCEKETWNTVKQHLDKFAEINQLRHIKLACENTDCTKEYETPLVFELANFFG